MNFWKRLRWIFTLLFLALLFVSWLGSEPAGTSPAAGSARRAPPVFHP